MEGQPAAAAPLTCSSLAADRGCHLPLQSTQRREAKSHPGWKICLSSTHHSGQRRGKLPGQRVSLVNIALLRPFKSNEAGSERLRGTTLCSQKISLTGPAGNPAARILRLP